MHIDFYGKELARLLGKPIPICSGLIRLAIRDSGKSINNIGLEDLLEIFSVQLYRRLESLRIPNYETLIENLTIYTINNQSIITYTL